MRRFWQGTDMERKLWTTSDDPRLAERMGMLWEAARRLASWEPPRGLQKFHGIEGANAEREARTQADVGGAALPV